MLLRATLRLSTVRSTPCLARSARRGVIARPAPSHLAPRSRRAATTSASAMASPALAAPPTGGLAVYRIPALSDNYIWLLVAQDGERGAQTVAVVDPAEAGPVATALDALGLPGLDLIVNTHHHGDHTGGNLALKRQYGARVIGPAADAARIPGLDAPVKDGDTFSIGHLTARTFDTPGHTRGHVCHWIPGADALFCGDTLFALGCGRLFEGTPAQMHASLAKLGALPRGTRVFCAHEYTESNARWAEALYGGGNAALTARAASVRDARAAGQPTVPSTLGEELDTNPFLRCGDPVLRGAVGVGEAASEVDVFAAVRGHKDRF